MEHSCGMCGKKIIWVSVPGGKPVPCDPELLTLKEQDKAERIVKQGGEAYRPHIDTCSGCQTYFNKHRN